MGREVMCRAAFRPKSGDAQSGQGKALLETSEIVFRGDFRVKIPLKGITKMDAAGGKLRVSFAGGDAVFDLGLAAEKWREKILNPPSLMDKLGVKAGSRVHVAGVKDAAFLRELKSRKPVTATKDCDVLFYPAELHSALKKLASLGKQLAPTGAIWVIYPKGRKEITELGVINAGRAAGYVDVKVARISDTHTGTKFMIPKDKR